ncbi:serine hydrolase domain-containing protein [Streptantibioticus ferralitis]|uniref:Serine hydrolase n=1 Tax=Streptantibioticus ferralitis TaxID=236510 RepID=A0ABT5Z8Y9_9ACTN|nr:serine hydrolase domain-containing protein [Streptantibioticus ferralitis]MDF2260287.1 serine hydrolase [Streptantibioticus ferralitis]
MEVHGTVADGFEPVREAFRQGFEQRGERGAAVAVHQDGRLVVDLWAGAARADQPEGPRWERDTAQIIRSAGKGPAAACLLLLHQRGQLDLDAPVGTYWPEFKAAGKERALVRHLLTHRVGVPALDTPLTVAQALDGVSGPRAVAAQRPQWQPGTDHGYHAQTFSWLLGELVLRATGRTLGQWFAQEVAGPLGLDLWFGLPPDRTARVGRVAAVEPPPVPAVAGLRTRPKRSVTEAYADPESLTRRAFEAILPPVSHHHPQRGRSAPQFPLPVSHHHPQEGRSAAQFPPPVAHHDPQPGRFAAQFPMSVDENDPAYQAGELAASNAIATARSLSRCYAALTTGVDGAQPLFTPATLTAARSRESDGPDRVLVVNTRFGHGFMLHGPSCPLLAPGSFGHPGRGGSLGFADPEAGIGFGYVTNGLQKSVTADPRAQALVRAVRSCLR